MFSPDEDPGLHLPWVVNADILRCEDSFRCLILFSNGKMGILDYNIIQVKGEDTTVQLIAKVAIDQALKASTGNIEKAFQKDPDTTIEHYQWLRHNEKCEDLKVSFWMVVGTHLAFAHSDDSLLISSQSFAVPCSKILCVESRFNDPATLEVWLVAVTKSTIELFVYNFSLLKGYYYDVQK